MKKIAMISAVVFVAGAGAAFAFSNSDNGNVPDQAFANCIDNIVKQNAAGLADKNKNKVDAPTNCDHFYN